MEFVGSAHFRDQGGHHLYGTPVPSISHLSFSISFLAITRSHAHIYTHSLTLFFLTRLHVFHSSNSRTNSEMDLDLDDLLGVPSSSQSRFPAASAPTTTTGTSWYPYSTAHTYALPLFYPLYGKKTWTWIQWWWMRRPMLMMPS